MRVVFDTNVLISALVFPGGRAEEALQKIMAGRDTLIISGAVLDELLSVLAIKFSRDAEALSRTALFLSEIAQTVKPPRKLKVLKDEPDNRILECALAGRAEAIVTGDKEMLELRQYKGVRILSLKQYTDR